MKKAMKPVFLNLANSDKTVGSGQKIPKHQTADLSTDYADDHRWRTD